MKIRLPLFAWILVALLAPGELRAGEKVSVTKSDATVQVKRYDPAKPPREKAKWGGFPGYTDCEYPFKWYLKHDSEQVSQPGNAEVIVKVTITKVYIKIGLTTTTWLPNDCPAALVEHEQGHQKIGEKAYEHAEVAARMAGERIVGQEFSASGADYQAAEDVAREQAGAALIAVYNGLVPNVTQRVHDLYDKVTDHGRNQAVSVADAIDKAIERYQSERQSRASR